MSEHWVRVNNRLVRYVVKGDGKPIVMVHGFSFNADDWINCCGDKLPGFRIYAIDMPYGPKSRSDHFTPREPNDYAHHHSTEGLGYFLTTQYNNTPCSSNPCTTGYFDYHYSGSGWGYSTCWKFPP